MPVIADRRIVEDLQVRRVRPRGDQVQMGDDAERTAAVVWHDRPPEPCGHRADHAHLGRTADDHAFRLQEIVDAIEACSTDDIVVLPNDKNVILTAQQAKEHTSKRVRVVPSRSVPQGIAAVLAINPDDSLDDNVRAMETATESVRTVEVTKAVRSTTIRGVDVREGQAIAIVDDVLTTAAESAEEAAVQALAEATGDDTSLISIYYGGDKTESDASKLGELVQATFESHEIEIVFGGQPHYDYIMSVE